MLENSFINQILILKDNDEFCRKKSFEIFYFNNDGIYVKI